MRSLLLCILLLLCSYLMGQPSLVHPYHFITAGSIRQADAFSWHLQPAALSGVRHFSAGMFAQQRFMLPYLTHSGISAVVPLNRQALGVSVQHMGGPLARQSEASVGFAQALGKQAALGLQFQYQSYRAAGYRQQGGLGYTLAARLQLAPGVQALASVSNPVPVQKGVIRQPPARYEVGMGADLSSQLFLGFSLLQVIGARPAVQAGLQYRVLRHLYGRLGILTGSGQFVVGGGYQLGAFRLDVCSAVHPQLGLSPGIQLLYQPPAKE